MNEADTCRKFITPKLQTAGWDENPYLLAEQRTFTNPKGRIRIVGGRIVRADALEHRPPQELVDSILEKEREILRLMEKVKLEVAALENNGKGAT
jgi:hypothetical protein